MAKAKLSLVKEITLKDVTLDSTQFAIPKKVRVNFSEARAKMKYVDRKPTDTIESYILNGIDEKTASAIEQGLVDEDIITPIHIEVEGSFDEIESAMAMAQVVYVELLDTRVKLMWVDGRNAGYKKVKLVVGGLKILV
ncbi:hypothetical protein [Streptococcus hyointestinalis]